jgi:hypothetical protein
MDRREEALEDLICDEEPNWKHPAFENDPVARDFIQVRAYAQCMHSLSHACVSVE